MCNKYFQQKTKTNLSSTKIFKLMIKKLTQTNFKIDHKIYNRETKQTMRIEFEF